MSSQLARAHLPHGSIASDGNVVECALLDGLRSPLPNGGASGGRTSRRPAARTNPFSTATEKNATLVELSRQRPVRKADSSHRPRRFAVRLQDPANIVFLTAAVVHESADLVTFASKKEKLINMSVSVCPIAIINAPIERVWTFLSEPANYALWWDAQTRSIVPEGRAQSGQKIHAKSSGLDVNVIVNSIDESKRQIHLTTMLPFGITVYNHITCTPLENETCQASFG